MATPFMTPVELDRVGIALGEVGFSPNIWDMESKVTTQPQLSHDVGQLQSAEVMSGGACDNARRKSGCRVRRTIASGDPVTKM